MKVIATLGLMITTFTLTAFAAPNPLDTVVPINNRAGLALMSEASLTDSQGLQKNILLSPLSYYLSLSMAFNGTENGTRAALINWFGSEMNPQSFNQSNTTFQNAVAGSPGPTPSQGLPPARIGITNSAWSNSAVSEISGGTFSFKTEFAKALKVHYGVDAVPLNFKEASSVDVINTWAHEKTEGLIPQIIDGDSLSKLTWVLLNATTIQAHWASPFKGAINPELGAFTKLDGQIQNVDMIENYGSYSVRQTADATAVEIPFHESDLSLILVIPPSPNEFAGLQTSVIWTEPYWNTLLSDLSQRGSVQQANVVLPKFSFVSGAQLKDQEPLTRGVGLQFLFDDTADFSAMSAPGSIPTKLGLLKQQTTIEVNENGLKAAAVSLVGGIEVTSAMEYENVIVANRPFFFAVASKHNGVILFTGSIVDPKLAE